MTEEQILGQIEPWSGLAPRGYWTNWLGAKTSVVFNAHWIAYETIQQIMAGERYAATRRPVFGDGEFYFEQVNIIRSVLGATDRYILVELGGGIGPRAVDAGLALQKLRPDIKPFLVVVEALPTYVEWCKFHFRANGLDPAEHWIVTGFMSNESIPLPFFLQPRGFGNQVGEVFETLTRIANDPAMASDLLQRLTSRGVILHEDRIIDGWPRTPVDISGFEAWPLQRIMETNAVPNNIQALAAFRRGIKWLWWRSLRQRSQKDRTTRSAINRLVARWLPKPSSLSLTQSAEIGFVSAVTMETILAPLSHVDLMDVDIQFSEKTVIPPTLDLLRRKVKLLSIGTHSKDIHHELHALFRQAGWKVMFDIDAHGTHSRDGMQFSNGDGVLTVQNPDAIS